MTSSPAGRDPRPVPWYRQPFSWMWGMRGWIAAAIITFFILASVYVVWAVQDMPDPNSFLTAGDIAVLDRNGHLIEDWSPAGHYHVNLTLAEMGKYAPTATMAAEDRNFYHHGGLDLGAILRAMWVDVTEQRLTEGGSTISQQLVKMQLLTPEKSIARKLHEMVLAVAMEERFSKDQILTMYMNRVYYGHGAYGIGAASRVYFNKDAKDLTVAQAAFLAGLVQSPSAYDPQAHYALAQERQRYVLNGMVAMDKLTSAEADQAAAEDVKAELKIQRAARQSKAPHFVDYVLTTLEKSFGAAAVQQGGFVVHTTLDLNLQAIAEQAVKKGVQDLKWANVNNAALLAADPKTGEVLAWVGSADYSNDAIAGQFDVVLALRQPGSSFKPYVYEAALRDHKITLATTLNDSPTNFNGYRPHDFDNGGMGKISARKALLFSRNIPAVQVGQMEGMTNVIDLAHEMGINTKLDPGLSTAIGGSDVTMYQHVQGYQVFANQGQRVDLRVIRSISDTSGATIYTQDKHGPTAILTPAESYLITDVLKHYQTQWGFGWNRQMASKTGTSDDGHGRIPDSWIMAYNSNIVAGVWVGNTAPDGRGGFITAFGESVGSTIMARFVNSLPSSMRGWYSQPVGISRGCGGQEIFLTGTQNSGCSTPTPSASSSASPSASPSAEPSPTPQPSPSPSPSPVPSAAPGGASPAPSPAP